MPRRLNILMLVPHEPSQDPRIHYTANTLARDHDVLVLATVRAKEKRPRDNTVGIPSTMNSNNLVGMLCWNFGRSGNGMNPMRA